ncbi:MAG: nucleotidyltransferase domain-containing protein [Gammaproteobacteria bacterium]|nr:nucleotidyltransferase domain-containing protein [Gammaproteobacteria bacterium]
MKLDLKDEQLNIVRHILQTYIPDYQVWAFGSRVKGTARKYSDLDLVVISQESLSLAIHADLAEAFSESDLPFKVDIVDWTTTSEAFQKIISENKIIIQI